MLLCFPLTYINESGKKMLQIFHKKFHNRRIVFVFIQFTPLNVPIDKHSRIEYWCADAEEKNRKLDIRYMKEHFPDTRFKLIRNAGHGGLATFQPDRLVKHLVHPK